MKIKTISIAPKLDIAPKWMTVYHIYKEWIQGGNKRQKDFVCSEFKRLCEAVDNSTFPLCTQH